VSNNKLAISLIIVAMFFGTLMLSFLKLAQEDVNVYTAGFLRFFFGLLIILPYIIKTKLVVFKTTHIKKHFFPINAEFTSNALIFFNFSYAAY
jgi:drug/metabolite transporter (DMT)-like permease